MTRLSHSCAACSRASSGSWYVRESSLIVLYGNTDQCPLSIQPSVIISVALGRSGLDTLLIASQVVLSLILPFVVFPLVWITSRRSGIMRVWIPTDDPGRTRGEAELLLDLPRCPSPAAGTPVASRPSSPPAMPSAKLPRTISLPPPSPSPSPVPGLRTQHYPPLVASPRVSSDDRTPAPPLPGRYEDFSSPWYVTVLGYVLFTIMLAANVYVIVQLALGRGG